MPNADWRVVELLLHSRAGGAVRVVRATGLGSDFAPVERLELDSGRTVICKQRRLGGEGWGFDLGNLRREYTAHEALHRLGVDIAAQVLAVDDRAGVLVLSDVGPGPMVEQLLMGSDPTTATDALVAAARVYGILHGRTFGFEATFDTCYRGLVPDETPADRSIWELDAPLKNWPRLLKHLVEIGFPSPDTAEFSELDELLRDERFRTLGHGDVMPHNILLRDRRAYLVDFESAGHRHIGIDAGFLRFPFQNYGFVLPQAVLEEMERTYRAELVDSPWNAMAITQAIVIGCVVRLTTLLYGIDRVDDEQQSAESARRRRARLVETTKATIDALVQADVFPALKRWLCAMLDEMRRRWREARRPTALFPAFRG